jgi:hypothetical protein
MRCSQVHLAAFKWMWAFNFTVVLFASIFAGVPLA